MVKKSYQELDSKTDRVAKVSDPEPLPPQLSHYTVKKRRYATPFPPLIPPRVEKGGRLPLHKTMAPEPLVRLSIRTSLECVYYNLI